MSCRKARENPRYFLLLSEYMEGSAFISVRTAPVSGVPGTASGHKRGVFKLSAGDMFSADAQTPRPALCLLRSFRREVSPSASLTVFRSFIEDHVLSIFDIAYYMSIIFFHSVSYILCFRRLGWMEHFEKGSYGMEKGSCAVVAEARKREFCSEMGVLKSMLLCQERSRLTGKSR